MHIVVSGVSGVGKTTWSSALAAHSGGVLLPEIVEPAGLLELARLHPDLSEGPFLSQMHYLMVAADEHAIASQSTGNCFQDNSIYEVVEFYTLLLVLSGRLSDQDDRIVRTTYEAIRRSLPPPDVVLFLKASPQIVRQRVAARARPHERIPSSHQVIQAQRYRRELWNDFGLPVVDLDTSEMGLSEPRESHLRPAWRALNEVS
jgi:deoxyadenosine/deoxycytidine kinase